MSQRLSQEFYCGECEGYFIVRLNRQLNHVAIIRCPNCKHEHRRCIVNGQIFEDGRYKTEHKERLLPTMAGYSKTPRTQVMRDSWYRRDGVAIDDNDRILLAELWLDTHRE